MKMAKRKQTYSEADAFCNIVESEVEVPASSTTEEADVYSTDDEKTPSILLSKTDGNSSVNLSTMSCLH